MVLIDLLCISRAKENIYASSARLEQARPMGIVQESGHLYSEPYQERIILSWPYYLIKVVGLTCALPKKKQRHDS